MWFRSFVLAAVGAAAMWLVSSAAQSATLTLDNGSLIGAEGLEVGGARYSVRFVDGTCVSLFDGCDDVSDFAFATQSAAVAAAEALLSEVFVDNPLGDFNAVAALTAGCTSSILCNAIIPYARATGTTSAHVIFTRNFSDAPNLSAQSVDSPLVTTVAATSFAAGDRTFAVFTPAISTVPLPGGAVLLLTAVSGFALRRGVRRRRLD